MIYSLLYLLASLQRKEMWKNDVICDFTMVFKDTYNEINQFEVNTLSSLKRLNQCGATALI